MDAERVARGWFLAALLYFLVSVCIGVYMGASGDHALTSIHAHVSLLGWGSMGLTGVIYRSFPAAAKSRLAAWHLLLYQLAVPVMLIAVAALALGTSSAAPVAGAASVAVLISIIVFCWNILSVHLGEERCRDLMCPVTAGRWTQRNHERLIVTFLSSALHAGESPFRARGGRWSIAFGW